MKLKTEAQTCDGSAASDHEWQPLFAPPRDSQQESQYMAHGHGDYMQCAKCGLITMRDGPSSGKPLALSQIFSDSKRREAAIWNANQQSPIPHRQSSPHD